MDINKVKAEVVRLVQSTNNQEMLQMAKAILAQENNLDTRAQATEEYSKRVTDQGLETAKDGKDKDIEFKNLW